MPWTIASSFTRVAAVRSTPAIQDSIIAGVIASIGRSANLGKIWEPSNDR
jgi:hypothetical protein